MTGKKGKYWNSSKEEPVIKEVDVLINTLKENVVLVEGKRDKEALERLGITNCYALVGRENSVFEKLKSVEEVIILTDLDRKGNLLASRVTEELWSRGIKTNLTLRKRLGFLMKIKYFEELDNKYEKLKR